MTAADLALAEKAFHAARGLDSAGQRLVLARLPPEVRRTVEDLLVADAACDKEHFLAAPLRVWGLQPTDFDSGSQAGRLLGAWRLVTPLGLGGMGAVWLAERADGQYEGRAAVKLLRAGLSGPEWLARWRRELATLAALRHPRICRLLDAGTAEDGTPYMVLEFVEGRPLDLWAKDQTLAERLRLFVDVATAVHHAHGQLVLHCDLKPSNILVEPRGQPKLLDFGLATLLGGDDTAPFPGGRVLTPGYASPEQLRGERPGVASDVFALGVILFELVSGRHPFRTSEDTFATLQASLQPVPGALELRLAPGERGSSLWQQDLATITSRALATHPAARHPSAQQLAVDVAAVLHELPLANNPDPVYRLAKLCRRRPRLLTAAVAAGIALIGALATTVAQATRAVHQRDLAIGTATAIVEKLAGQIAALPATTATRLGLLEAARDTFERTNGRGEATSSDGDVRHRLARAWIQIAEAYQSLGQAQRALDAATTAAALAARPGVGYPEEVRRRDVAESLARRFVALRALGLGATREGIDMANALRSALPTLDGATDGERVRAFALRHLGNQLEIGAGDLPGALQDYRAAVTAALAAVAAEPGSPRPLLELAQAQELLGIAEFRSGRTAEGLDLLLAARDAVEAGLRAAPLHPLFLYLAGSSARLRGSVLCLGGRIAEGLAEMERGREHLRLVLQLDPELRIAAADLVALLDAIGYTHSTQGRREAAVAAYEEAFALSMELAEKGVESTSNLRSLVHLVGNLAPQLIAEGRADLAAARLAAARRLLDQALASAPGDRDLVQRSGVLDAAEAEVALARGDLESAASALASAAAVHAAQASRSGAADDKVRLARLRGREGDVARLRGRPAEARNHYAEAVRLLEELHQSGHVAVDTEALAEELPRLRSALAELPGG